MDYTGKPIKRFIFFYPEGYDLDENRDLQVRKALALIKEIRIIYLKMPFQGKVIQLFVF